MFTAADREFMARALQLAERGMHSSMPNPRVGCVLVRDGVVVGEGWHEWRGQAHAEVHALAEAGARARGATAYVTLEPCNHRGSTGPCVDALVQAGVGRVIAAMEDPNPAVNGHGLQRLRQAGIDVRCGLLAHEARELNIGFVSRMTRARPWVRMKMASSLDGRCALRDGRSQWITGAAARADGHAWRARSCAILTGIGTVRDDNPQMNVRHVAAPRQPLRVLIDSRLEVNPAARIVENGGTLVICALPAQEREERTAALVERGCEVITLAAPGPQHGGGGQGAESGESKSGNSGTSGEGGHGGHGGAARPGVDLAAVLAELARREMNEVHVEAGARLSGAFLQAGLVDELLLYLAPMLLGDALPWAALPEVPAIDQAWSFRYRSIERIGEDVRLLARRTARDHDRE